jgi:hypothetical protein
MATDRFYISALGEHYSDCLKVEAFIKGRTMASEGNSLLCAKLMEREARRNEIVAYLAKKRNITPEQFWDDILAGEAKPLNEEEFRAFRTARESTSEAEV